MKKLYSLLRASMTSDMNLFKIKTRKSGKRDILISLFIAGYLMFMIWGSANSLFEKLSPMHIQYIMLSVFAFGISVMTLMEGVYKTGPLIFNCKDDQLLLSLPIKRRTVLFVRVFKFYVFEILFNSLFLLPIMIAYIRWADTLSWTYFLTSFVMLFLLPIIPIVISCFIGAIISNVSSRFKYKNIIQIILSMVFLLGILLISYNMNTVTQYLIKNVSSINDFIIKIYYPAGIYAKLVTDFNILDLLVFILINVGIFILSIYILSKFYFKINSRMKRVITSKKVNINKLNIRARSKTMSLIKKELTTFFKIPVFIINSGFALVLFIICTIVIVFKFDSIMPILINEENGLGLSKDIIMNNLSVLIFLLISVTSYMTSITNSVISLEGRNINILKSLPISGKCILMSKIYSCLVITTPVLFVGSIILFIKFKISFIEMILLLILIILIPLVSHFIGLIVNLKYPKLDATNSAEVVKQSISSFISVMIGMILLIVTVAVTINLMEYISAILFLVIIVIIYLVIDTIFYIYLINRGVKDFNNLII